MLVHQDYRLLTDDPVVEILALPLIIAGMHPKDANTGAMASFNRVGLRDQASCLGTNFRRGTATC